MIFERKIAPVVNIPRGWPESGGTPSVSPAFNGRLVNAVKRTYPGVLGDVSILMTLQGKGGDLQSRADFIGAHGLNLRGWHFSEYANPERPELICGDHRGCNGQSICFNETGIEVKLAYGTAGIRKHINNAGQIDVEQSLMLINPTGQKIKIGGEFSSGVKRLLNRFPRETFVTLRDLLKKSKHGNVMEFLENRGFSGEKQSTRFVFSREQTQGALTARQEYSTLLEPPHSHFSWEIKITFGETNLRQAISADVDSQEIPRSSGQPVQRWEITVNQILLNSVFYPPV